MFRVSIMFILTIITATIEIVYGVRSHSDSLIADGLYSFAEGLCLIGVLLVLRYSKNAAYRDKHNTFGHERLELLFGLIQEVFLLSISLGIIVDAVNHLLNPRHIHDPQLMIVLGIAGIFVGAIGMLFFWGYHHDHNIEEEISQKKKSDFLAWTNNHAKLKRTPTVVVEVPLLNVEQGQNENSKPIQPSHPELDAYTYENVQMGESRIYATLHALCLHSFVRLFTKNIEKTI